MIESQLVDEAAYQAAVDFLYDRINYERLTAGSARFSFRLQRTDQLLRELDLSDYLYSQSPVAKVPIVHIAGTKGKGSTSAMVAAALTNAGLKTGLYTSPHLQRLEERFQIDGQPCPPADLVSLVERIEPVTKSIAGRGIRPPSFFELTTAIALLHFDTQACDVIVLEVGLGGRLDSTNVIAPAVTAITSIGLDHQRVLGYTLSEIAEEKAGILKKNIPVISGVVGGEAADVIQARAAEETAPLYQLGRDFSFEYHPQPDWGGRIDYRGSTPPLSQASLTLAMEGAHQAHNAALALAIVDVLRDQGREIEPGIVKTEPMALATGVQGTDAASVRPAASAVGSRKRTYSPSQIEPRAAAAGISATACPGRIERFRLPEGVTVIVDSAHNADSMDALCECLRDRAAGRRIAVVFGTSRDKQAGPMLERLSSLADELVLTRFQGNPRYTQPAKLYDLMPPSDRPLSRVVERLPEACRTALASVTPGGLLVVCGSFFLAAEARQWLLDFVDDC